MKVIPKLQDGGFMSLFTQYTPIQSQAPSQQARGSSSREERSSEREESTKGKLTEKDLFELVSQIDGLPNDTRALVSSLQNMFQMQQLTGTSDIADLASTYLSNLYQIKLADYNKKEYDKAYQEVIKNGGLNEYAITASGQVIVLNEKDNLEQINVSELLKGEGKYRPLTNSNLLYLRAYQPEYINNNQILNTVSNGIGMEQVDKMIRERLSSLGTSETVRSGYSIKNDNYIMQGLNVLSQIESAAIAGQAGMTLDGMYKNKIITKDQKQQAEAALQYIYNTLPDNAKTLLSIKAGNASNPQAGAQAVILQLITSRMNQTNSSETTWGGTLEQVTKSGKGSNDGSDNGSNLDDLKLNTASKWLAGFGDKNSIVINAGTSRFTSVETNTMPLVKMNGDYLGPNSTLQQMAEGQFASILDINNASMGMNTIDTAKFNKVLLTDGNINSIDFPCIEKDGYIVPDLSTETVENKKKAESDLKKMGISLDNKESIKANYATINKVYKDNGLQPAYNENGEIVSPNWRRFGVINGKASNDVLGMGQFDSNILLEEDQDDNNIQNYIDITKYEGWDDRKYFGLSGIDHLWKGTIWIPVKVDYNAALASTEIKSGQAMALEQAIQELKMQQSLVLGRQLQN